MSTSKQELIDFDFLSVLSKIELWLCARDLKPACAIPAEEREDFVRWLGKAGLLYMKVPDSELFIVSKDLEKMNSLLPIVFSNSEIDIKKKCELYGYPKNTFLAAYRNFAETKDNLPVGVGVKKDNDFGITWWPYVRYVVRQGHEYDDSLVAKKWSKVIKKELPALDRQLEESLIKIL